jgi:hypothetical protein
MAMAEPAWVTFTVFGDKPTAVMVTVAVRLVVMVWSAAFAVIDATPVPVVLLSVNQGWLDEADHATLEVMSIF